VLDKAAIEAQISAKQASAQGAQDRDRCAGACRARTRARKP
jgi:hypothetical protein